ncbi:MAG TPA: tetratricopeptide repeat protein [Nitrospiria bacterium]|nr:tetratricopeptide repeat protein [Nitrospiria bacterium]
MSIIHEALKKASRDEAPEPRIETPRRVLFSTASRFPPHVNLIGIGILVCLIGSAYLVYVEREALRRVFVKKGIAKTSNVELPLDIPASSVASKTQGIGSKTLSRQQSVATGDSAEAHEKKGADYLEKGKLRDAEREFLLAESLDPRSSVIQNNLGFVMKREGRDGDAESRYRTALQMDPENVQAMNNLGLLYQEQNRLEEAKRLFQEAVQAQPNFPDSHLNYAILLERAGYIEESKQHYRSFLVLASPQQEQAVQLVKKHLNHLP